jgi:hypothetical protein
LGLKGTLGAADRPISGLPALRDIAPVPNRATAVAALPTIDSYQHAIVDEVVEIRLGFDGETGSLAIVDGDVRHQVRQVTPPMSSASASGHDTLAIPDAVLGSRVDLVA